MEIQGAALAVKGQHSYKGPGCICQGPSLLWGSMRHYKGQHFYIGRSRKQLSRTFSLVKGQGAALAVKGQHSFRGSGNNNNFLENPRPLNLCNHLGTALWHLSKKNLQYHTQRHTNNTSIGCHLTTVLSLHKTCQLELQYQQEVVISPFS